MWSQHSMMTCITVLPALKLPVSDRAVQSSGNLLKAELDCSDTIFFILSKVPQWARWVQTSSSPLVPWLSLSSDCMSQFAILWLPFSNFPPIFFSGHFYLWLYVRNILVHKTLTCLNLSQNKTFLSHIFLVLSLNVAKKVLIAKCTSPGHFGFHATSFPMNKIRLNLLSVSPLTFSTSSKLLFCIK